MKEKAVETLDAKRIKATPNRILVLESIIKSNSPLSLIDIEKNIGTLDRSSVLRVLTLLLEHDILHVLQDGNGVSRYELCRGDGHCSIADMHVHFFCEKCGHTYCFEHMPVPKVETLEGFDVHSANYMLKGICAKCKIDTEF